MVLKVGKGGVRTGNQLSAKKSQWFMQQYRTDSCIVRSVVPGTGEFLQKIAPALGPIDVPSDNIPYSLNKKKRWLLPELLREHILTEDHGKEKYGIQLLEYQKVKRKANCVAYHATWGPVHEVHAEDEGKTARFGRKKKRRKNAFIASSTYTTMKTKVSKEEPGRFPDRETEIDEEEVEFIPTNQRYSVVYPGSETNAAIYNESVNRLPNIGRNYDACYWLRPRRRHCWDQISGSHSGKNFLLHDALEEMADRASEKEFWEEEEADMKKSVGNQERTHSEFILEDFICSATVRKSACKRSKRKRSTLSNSSDDISEDRKRVVFVDNEWEVETHGAENDVKTDSTLLSSSMKPVRVILPVKDVELQTLYQKYGNKYTECDCYPRKFLLDISEEVDSIVSQRDTTTLADNAAFLVFCQDTENERDGVFNVTLNIESEKPLQDFRIETLFDNTSCSVEEVLQSTLFYVETLSMEVLSFVQKPLHYKRLVKNKGLVWELTGWESHSYNPRDKNILENLMKTPSDKVKGNLDSGVESHSCSDVENINTVISKGDQFCNICYAQLEGSVLATALRSCGHWFCDACWIDHLRTLVNNGQTKLGCPEYECDRRVDTGTMISLLDIGLVLKHAKHCHDNDVIQGQETKWCPNESCGCVLKVGVAGQKNVRCHCGRTVCFDCLGNPHWPVPCDIKRSFIRKQREKGDGDILPQEALEVSLVKGKHCPHCKLFIEKNGGCPYMSCRCGGAFCWGCMQNWFSVSHGPECYKNGTINEFNAETVELHPVNRLARRKKHQWYRLALFHQTQQHPMKVMKLRRSLPELTKTIQGFMKRSRKAGNVVLIEHRQADVEFKYEGQKVPYFLESMVDLHTELHVFMEHTAVLLDYEGVPVSSRPALVYLLQRMSIFSAFLQDLILSGAKQDPKQVLDRLLDLRQHSRRAIRGMVKIVNKEIVEE